MKLIAMLAGALLFSSTALADENCKALPDMLSFVNSKQPIRAQVTLTAEQAERVSVWFNHIEPVSDEHFNLVVVLQHRDGQFGVLLGNDGQICFGAPLIPEALRSFFRAIAGEPDGEDL